MTVHESLLPIWKVLPKRKLRDTPPEDHYPISFIDKETLIQSAILRLGPGPWDITRIARMTGMGYSMTGTNIRRMISLGILEFKPPEGWQNQRTPWNCYWHAPWNQYWISGERSYRWKPGEDWIRVRFQDGVPMDSHP